MQREEPKKLKVKEADIDNSSDADARHKKNNKAAAEKGADDGDGRAPRPPTTGSRFQLLCPCRIL